MISLIDKLADEKVLSKEEFARLIDGRTPELAGYLFSRAREVRRRYYGDKVFIRGLIEFTNFCKNDCLYCGIRKCNAKADRYRLDKDEILACCDMGYGLGFRTFVLQGGEDGYYTDNRMVDIISAIRAGFPDCAITLSVGERSHESYLAYFKAGANRYLLRHETANPEHYRMLHPPALSSENRKRCLYDLKAIGYQVGTGFMVGSPYQTSGHLAEDLLFIHELQPHMVGIGPFIPHKDTPFRDHKTGTAELTVFLIGILRLMLPNALIPATTALGTVDPKGREMGILAGANVVMPNLSPLSVRSKYTLYDNKICTGDEAAECRMCIERRIAGVGYRIVVDRGDYVPIS